MYAQQTLLPKHPSKQLISKHQIGNMLFPYQLNKTLLKKTQLKEVNLKNHFSSFMELVVDVDKLVILNY